MLFECPKDGRESPRILLVSCPGCGSEIEVFSDEEATVCEDCGREVKNQVR